MSFLLHGAKISGGSLARGWSLKRSGRCCRSLPHDSLGEGFMPTLAGTGRLADDLFLVAHDDVTGRCYLQSRALGIGLAAALLAELLFAGAIVVQADRIALTLQQLPGNHDALGHHMLRQIQAEREWHPLRDWLLYFGRNAEEQVAGRLRRAGYVNEADSWWPWRKHRYVPTDSDCWFASRIRVKAVMEPGRPVSVPDVVLSGLALACGLGSHVLQYGSPEARACVEAAVVHLPYPGLRELIAQAQVAIDSAVLSRRV